MDDIFSKPYDPSATEDRMYALWEKSGFFNPDNLPGDRTEAFSVVLPPPNVTGVLHVGHAYEDALQDAVVRYHRMRGKRTLWIPGTDSAAIATQARVEKDIRKSENKTRHDLGREELIRRVSEFAKGSENTILGQIRKMGASLDWSRYAYTLDEARNFAVVTAFKRMYDAGLIYRGHRVVNWDPKGQTTISDDEVQYKEKTATFYYFKYGPFVIGTARPETKFGDKYVVVHPTDNRYKKYTHGQKIELEWINGPITATVIKDEAADPEVGSGAMTITPWHSHVDFEIAERHNLDKEQIIDRYGKLLNVAEEFAGMNIEEAREKIVAKLDAKGLLVKTDDTYIHNIAISERTGATVEPQIMEQWFVAVDKPFRIPHSDIPGIQSGEEITLKHMMRTALESGAVSMPQAGFRKSYFHWIDNLHDWCISRQIWFGHRIPVWYKHDTNTRMGTNDTNTEVKMYVGVEEPEESGWVQDEDVLDTWFSSALWTFSTLGWPGNDARGTATLNTDGSINPSSDLGTYHPTAFMSPAYEILFLWISRMILMSGFHLGQIPFHLALIHGLVRDKNGRKFSKSLGNGVEPLEVIERYGADALRMSLLVGTAIGNDISFDENRVKGYKHFANKLWNIARFVLTNTNDYDYASGTPLEKTDQKHSAELGALVADVTDDMEAHRLYLASEKIYHYTWHTFADTILEESKEILNGDNIQLKESRQTLLLDTLSTILRLLHPFMPFVTEAIWQHLPDKIKDHELLLVSSWPEI